MEKVDIGDEEEPKYRCKVENCSRVLCGKQRSNISQHVRNCHREFYNLNIKRPVTSSKEFEIKRLKFIQDCAEIIAINGCSFRFLCQSGFKNLVAEKVNELVDAGYGKGLEGKPHKAVREHIKYQASEIEKQIRDEVKGKFVAIMIDAASKNSKSFLGISLQFVLDGVVTVRSAGVIEILSSQTSNNLMHVLMGRLRVFGIEKEQIIAITTDNGPNMTATVKRVNTFREEDEADALGATSDDDDSVYSDDEDEDSGVSSNIRSQEDDNRLNELLDDGPEIIALLEMVLDKYAMQTLDIYGIRCAAHTLQLAILRTLSKTEHKDLLDLFRKVASHLRTPTSIRIIREQNIRVWLPRLDVVTRWSSFYRMVRSKIYSIIVLFYLSFCVFYSILLFS